MTPAAQAVQDRKAFELYWMASRVGDGHRKKLRAIQFFNDDGTYRDDRAQRHWWTFQNALSFARTGTMLLTFEQVEAALRAEALDLLNPNLDIFMGCR